ncbi:MAG: hypothetical protein HOO96_34555 [Polyangiaceae bacterium]|nr:hypothetical protein [Polyangiaceae bacterium]
MRAFGYAAFAFGLAFALGAATDEGGLSLATRASRVLPLAPVAALVGTLWAATRARGRGEMRAALALGATPLDFVVPWTAGASLVVAFAAAALGAGAAMDGFFPAPPSAPHFAWTGNAFEGPDLGIRILGDGQLEAMAKAATAARTLHHGRLAAVLVTALSGVAMALLGATWTSAHTRRYLGSLGAAVALTVVALQAAAAERITPLLATLPGLALALYAGYECRRTRLARSP